MYMKIEGIGTDVVSKERIKKSNVENRFLTKIEMDILSNIPKEGKLDFVSGRWAAKEAIVKASNKSIVFSSISIIKEKNGKPLVLIDGEPNENIHISISHEQEYSVAFCIIENKV